MVCFTACALMAQSAWHHGHMPDRQDSDREVLTSLPRSRPVRRSAKRGDREDSSASAKDGAAAPTTTTAAPKRTAKPRAANAKAPAASTKPRTTNETSRPAGAPPKPANAAHRPSVAPRRKVPPAGYAAPDSRAEAADASAAIELVSTAIQAANELAQIGLTVGRQTLRTMIDRLPKP